MKPRGYQSPVPPPASLPQVDPGPASGVMDGVNPEPCPCPFCPSPMVCATERAKPLPNCPTRAICQTCREGLGHGRWPYHETVESRLYQAKLMKEGKW